MMGEAIGRGWATPKRSSRMTGRLLGHFAFVLLVWACALPAHAQSIAPVQTGSTAALATSADVRALATLDGRPLAFANRAAWRLDSGGTWSVLAWPASADDLEIAGGIDDGQRAWLLMAPRGTSGVTRVATVRVRNGTLSLKGLPDLPRPLSHAIGATSGNSLYLAGRNTDGTSSWYRIEPDAERPAWTPMPDWSGGGSATAMAVQGGKVFMVRNDGATDTLIAWSSREGWSEQAPVPGRAVAGSMRPLGQANLMLVLANAAGTARFASFETITRAWSNLPGPAPTQATAFGTWRDGLRWAAPASHDSVAFGHAQVQSTRLLLRWVDWAVIITYLVAMVGIGLYYYLREKRNSTAGFFLGGRSIPFWAAGISLYAANTSSISFIAIPAKAFDTNWQYLTNNLVAVLGLMFVAVWVVPLLRRLDLMSVFTYLETRFHPAIRMIASALCIVTQIGSRMSVILFLPALALSTVSGVSVTWSVILMGGFTILYTAMGGMKAVIWTDVAQFVVMMGGALFAIGFMIWHLHGGVGEFWSVATAGNKMKLLDFRFDLTQATVWGFIFLVLFDVVLTFPKDQVLMQRALSTGSAKEAGRSIWAFAAIMVPGGFVFYLIGTALFVYYRAFPERLDPTLPIDATFPLFIAAELPAGITGLIIAGIFAAAMSTLSGIINSVATLVSVDFYEKLVRRPSQRKSVLLAELATVATGLVGIGTALLLSRFDIHSLFDVSIELAGLLGGGFAGAYTLGMFTRRANAPGVAIGIGSSVFLTLIAWSFKLVHPYFYLAISILLCIVIGYVASLFFPPPGRSLKGLTIYTDKAA